MYSVGVHRKNRGRSDLCQHKAYAAFPTAAEKTAVRVKKETAQKAERPALFIVIREISDYTLVIFFS